MKVKNKTCENTKSRENPETAVGPSAKTKCKLYDLGNPSNFGDLSHFSNFGYPELTF